MVKSSKTATIVVISAVLLAIYEMLAVVFIPALPTITEVIEDLPELVEFAIVGGLMAWLALHFKWFSDLLKLLGK